MHNFAMFGPAGNAESFKAQGYKSNLDIPQYLKSLDLDIYEYQCGRGVKISQESAVAFGQSALNKNITISLHGPYYISLSGEDEQKRLKSVDYIMQSAVAANFMGADRVIVHSGSCAKISRETALSLAKDTLRIALKTLDENNLSHISICPETMGKVNQLGTFEEVLELCKIHESLIPCIDFGHLYARSLGADCGIDFYNSTLDMLKNTLGHYRYNNFHCHFSKIEFTQNGGEKKHITFGDDTFGPDFKPFIDCIYERGLTPRIICESAGTQAEDAVAMKSYYKSLKKD